MPHGGQHPTEEAMTITRKFLGGEPGLPDQSSGVAQDRAFGQQGQRKRRQGDSGIITPSTPPPTGGALSERFLNIPGPVGFSQTPQGRSILQRILGERFGRRI